MTSGSYLFKHFQRILSEWPTETGKGSSRNLKVFLDAKANALFQPLPQQQGEAQTGQRHNDSADRMIAPGVSVIECKRQLEALQQLANSQHQRDFPVPYTSGMFGYSRETIQQMNSDEGLKKLRIYVEGEKKPSKLKDIIAFFRGNP
uniref:Mitochondrial nucleoid factor 1 n=1 Tax=Globodera pallida TaxID=36090 RepID=A0A183BVH5_GLOPA